MEWDEDMHHLLRCREHGPYVSRYGHLGGTICPQCPNVFYDMVAEYAAKQRAAFEAQIEREMIHGSATG